MDVETNNQSTPPVQTTAPASSIGSAAPNKGGTGPVIGIIVIVIILALGALYFWYDAQMPATESLPADESVQASVDSVLDALTTTSSQDTASAIEADLQSTNTGNASADLQVQ